MFFLILSTVSSGEPGSAVEGLEGASEAARGGGEGADSEACRGPGGQQGEVTGGITHKVKLQFKYHSFNPTPHLDLGPYVRV